MENLVGWIIQLVIFLAALGGCVLFGYNLGLDKIKRDKEAKLLAEKRAREAKKKDLETRVANFRFAEYK